MNKALLAIASTITAIAAGSSFYLSTLPNPTQAQTNLANTANTIAIGGATAIFGLLNEDEDDQNDKDA